MSVQPESASTEAILSNGVEGGVWGWGEAGGSSSVGLRSLVGLGVVKGGTKGLDGRLRESILCVCVLMARNLF